MEVYKKRMANGDLSLNYFFWVEQDGRVRERNTGTADKDKAVAYAKRFFHESGQARGTQSVVRDMLDSVVGRESIPIAEAFEVFTSIPTRRPISEDQLRVKRRHWEDFLWFLRERCTWVEDMADVTREMANDYMQHLRTHGKFHRASTQRLVEFNRRTAPSRGDEGQQLSPSNCNAYHSTLQQIFHVLSREANLVENPFDAVRRLDKDDDTREAFTPEELVRIAQNADPFLFPIVAIGVYTGLPESEICLLRCSEVDLEEGWITHRLEETGMLIRVPILPNLFTYVARLKDESGSDYLLPAQAGAFLERRSSVRRLLTEFLETLDLRRKTRVPGRSTFSSVKDAQSLRHTFCYIAAANRLPLAVVKNIVGHVSQEIGDMYAGADDTGLQRVISEYCDDHLGLPTGGPLTAAQPDSGTAEVVFMLKSMTPENWAFMRDELLKILAQR